MFSVSVIGDVAKKIFDNIRKRFNKARNRIKASSKSGISTNESKDIADIPTGYEFLQWLTPYINPRKTKNNFVVTEGARSQDFRGSSEEEEGQEEDDFREDFREELKLPEPVKLDNPTFGDSRTDFKPANKKISPVTGKAKWKKNASTRPSTSSTRPSPSSIEEKELEFLNNVSKMTSTLMSQQEQQACSSQLSGGTTADASFGNFITQQLTSLPKRLKISCMHEMNQVLFKYQMQEDFVLTQNQEGTQNTNQQTMSYAILNSFQQE